MYRESSRRCPFCTSAMEGRPLSVGSGDGQVDVCEDCGAAFFDFDDGEPRVLAKHVLRSGGVHVQPVVAPELRECPACTAPLHETAYLEIGPKVLRCGSCGGLAATRSQLLALVAFIDVDPPPVESPTLLRRALRALGLIPGSRDSG